MNYFSKNLRFLREEKKLRLDDFETLGIKKGTMSNYELGKTEPKFETLQALAAFFDISLEDLINLDIQASPVRHERTAGAERRYSTGQANSISTDGIPAYKTEPAYTKKGLNKNRYTLGEINQMPPMDFMKLVLDSLDLKNTQILTLFEQVQQLELLLAELDKRIARAESELLSLKN